MSYVETSLFFSSVISIIKKTEAKVVKFKCAGNFAINDDF